MRIMLAAPEYDYTYLAFTQTTSVRSLCITEANDPNLLNFRCGNRQGKTLVGVYQAPVWLHLIHKGFRSSKGIKLCPQPVAL